MIETRGRGCMERINLRDAARRTARSVTTLSRYIRSGRLQPTSSRAASGPSTSSPREQLEDRPASTRPNRAVPSRPRGPAGPGAAHRQRCPDRCSRSRPPRSIACSGTACRSSCSRTSSSSTSSCSCSTGWSAPGGCACSKCRPSSRARRRQIEDAQAENTRVKERLAREAGDLREAAARGRARARRAPRRSRGAQGEGPRARDADPQQRHQRRDRPSILGRHGADPPRGPAHRRSTRSRSRGAGRAPPPGRTPTPSTDARRRQF